MAKLLVLIVVVCLAWQASAWQYSGIEADIQRAAGDDSITIGLIRTPACGFKQVVNLRWEYRYGTDPSWVVDVAQIGKSYRIVTVPGARGIGRVSVSGSGADAIWVAQVNGTTIASGVWPGGNASDGGDYVHVTATSDHENATAIGRVTVYWWAGGSTSYAWSGPADVAAWRVTGWPVPMGGWLTNRTDYCLRK